MMLTRRELLAAGAASAATRLLPASAGTGGEGTNGRLGIVSHSFTNRLAGDRRAGGGLADPIAFLEHCHALGAGGIQLPLGVRDQSYTAALRAKAEAYQMYVEGSIGLPRDPADSGRFTNEVRTAHEAGASVIRTVMLGSRRYETFTSAEAFRAWSERGFQALVRAEPVVARAGLRLAVENHKDWRVDELLAILKRLDSRHVGVCVDTGNSIALLEDPLEVVEAYAPWAYTTHLKDMAVREYEDGFLLAEVPLGEGFLDLKKIVAVLRAARPELHLGLEMITRDPLKVPCLTPRYWATFARVPGRDLARTLALVRKHGAPHPLARLSELSPEAKLRAEEQNVRRCLAYARQSLGS
jgi:sugar phosphate isomerase/epimerase